MAVKLKSLRLLIKVTAVLILVLAWLWGATALWLAGPGPHWVQILIALAFGSFLPAAFIFSDSFAKGCTLSLFLFALLLLWWQTLTPTNEKDWALDVARISHGEIQGNTLAMYNVRSFDYKSETLFYQHWETRNYNLKNLQGMDIFLSYWASDHIAHIILSWDFGEDGHLPISIETRKDLTQEYSSIKGFFKQFEICYIAADEKDIIRLRTNFRKERVYLYRLQVSQQAARALLEDYLAKMNSLVDEPDFYNALSHNCTTTIQIHASAIRADRPPPLDWRLIASGHVDELLYDRGVISSKLPLAQLRKMSRIDLIMQKEGKDDFSKIMRQHIEKAQDHN
jgi:hypothetical protein